jgi:uncharacterized protein YjbI with pentapeptide repeats
MLQIFKTKHEKSLKNTIDRYKNGLLETRNLQISNENFSTEAICDEYLDSSSFKNLSLLNVNFDSSFFKECLFQNVIFDSTSLQDAEFENCSLTNYQLRNCNLSESDFTETIFKREYR